MFSGRKIIILGLLVFAFGSELFSKAGPEEPQTIAEGTFKVAALGGEEILYFAFCAGDKMIFSFEEVDNKELKEVEILEYPSTSKFMDYKTTKVEGKMIESVKTTIYKFRFYNSAVGGRVCKYKIIRIPASIETKNFNTTVYWKTLQDTTTYVEQEKYLAKTEMKQIMVIDQTAKVSSQNALNGNSNRNLVEFNMPENTIAWSYYIGVGTEGKNEYEAAKERFLNTSSKYVATIPGYGALGALALEGISVFNQALGEDNVKYRFITDADNAMLFRQGQTYYQYKQGDVINDYQQMTINMQKGPHYLGLINDNIMDVIEVHIKIVAITKQNIYATRPVTKYNIRSYKVPYLRN